MRPMLETVPAASRVSALCVACCRQFVRAIRSNASTRWRIAAAGVFAGVGCMLASAGAVADASGGDPNLAQARQLTDQFARSLKQELKTALKKGGAANAIEACHLKAPDIATDLSDASRWEVRRTSLKVRNLEDAPDKWEAAVLERFEKQNAAGADDDEMEYSEIVAGKNGGRVFRYMKAITTQRICLKCHGEKIDAGVRKQLDSLYPFDQATGFTEDDLRGAFSLSKRVE